MTLLPRMFFAMRLAASLATLMSSTPTASATTRAVPVCRVTPAGAVVVEAGVARTAGGIVVATEAGPAGVALDPRTGAPWHRSPAVVEHAGRRFAAARGQWSPRAAVNRYLESAGARGKVPDFHLAPLHGPRGIVRLVRQAGFVFGADRPVGTAGRVTAPASVDHRGAAPALPAAARSAAPLECRPVSGYHCTAGACSADTVSREAEVFTYTPRSTPALLSACRWSACFEGPVRAGAHGDGLLLRSTMQRIGPPSGDAPVEVLLQVDSGGRFVARWSEAGGDAVQLAGRCSSPAPGLGR